MFLKDPFPVGIGCDHYCSLFSPSSPSLRYCRAADPGMAQIVTTLLYIIWSSGLNPVVLSADVAKEYGDSEDGGPGISLIEKEIRERRIRQAVIERNQHGKWLNGVNYIFSANASDYLYVTDAGGYYSHVGKVGGRQTLSLESNCGYVIGRAIHEIGHALGLYHTHSRYDRDSYVTVSPDYLKNTDEFRIITKSESENYGSEYDYGSIMHL
ncbi:astacin [Ancylostoma caninum]|uniref:Metalloendopeptidase n=1 Tax=Ancylostoma caninum TaxID=29170 RepID=A0A368GB17_ANCCA|nr:astacin [Ancylostoma caninum]